MFTWPKQGQKKKKKRKPESRMNTMEGIKPKLKIKGWENSSWTTMETEGDRAWQQY